MSRESRALLLPCPFCGSTYGSGLTIGYKGQPSTSWHVYCIKCKTTGPDAYGAHGDTANNAIALWNKRSEGSENAPASDEQRVVLSYSGLLVDDDSPLLDDKEWLAAVVNSKAEEGDDYGQLLLRLSVYPGLEGQAALDFILKRRVERDSQP